MTDPTVANAGGFASEHHPEACGDYLAWLAKHGNERLTLESEQVVDEHWKEVHGR